MKMLLSLAILCCASSAALAETVAARAPEPGHWVIVRESVEPNGRAEAKRPDPQVQPWNRPTPLQGQTQRWNVQWEPNQTTQPARELKI